MAEKSLVPQVLDGTPSDEESPSLGQFEFWLKDLANCASWLVNIIALDHTGIDVLAADESEAFFFKLKCGHAARSRVARAFYEAESKMTARTHAPESGSVYHNFKRHFDTQLDDLKGQLEALRAPENSAIVDEIELYLTASTIHSKAKKIIDGLAGSYHLRDKGDYCTNISYDVYDPAVHETGLAKLIGKGFARYGFNCFEAIRAIEEDAQAALNRFQEDFNSQIQEEILVGIVEPIQTILPQLRAKTASLSA